MRRYRLGAVEVASEIELPGVPIAPPRITGATITIRRGPPPPVAAGWRDHPETADPAPGWITIDNLRSADDRWYRIRYDYRGQVADFAIRSDGREITVDAAACGSDDEIANLIEGPILARALRLAGCPCLHATALAVGQDAIALAGASGAGKSSLAWAMVQQGCRLLSVDMLVIETTPHGPIVHPGRVRLRMWPDVARALGVTEQMSDILYPTADEMDKVVVDAPSMPGSEPVRLRAVYLLLPRSSRLAEPEIAPVEPRHAFIGLTANFHGRIPPGRDARRRELAMLAAIVRAVPVYTLTLPDDLPSLSDIASGLRRRLFA